MDTAELGVVMFSVGSFVFGTGVEHILSVITSSEKISQIGESVQLFSLSQYLETTRIAAPESLSVESPAENDGKCAVLLMDTGNDIAGVIVDSVCGVVSISLEKIEPLPDFVKNRLQTDCIWGIGKLGEELLILLDLDRYLLHMSETATELADI